MPVKELKGFQNVAIPQGSSKTVSFRRPATESQKWDLATNSWNLYPGNYQVNTGASPADTWLSAVIKIENQ